MEPKDAEMEMTVVNGIAALRDRVRQLFELNQRTSETVKKIFSPMKGIAKDEGPTQVIDFEDSLSIAEQLFQINDHLAKFISETREQIMRINEIIG